MSITWPFGNLKRGGYSMLMIDPPWSFKNFSAKGHAKGAQAQYSCMSLDDIKVLPVGDLAAKDCIVFLWATSPMIQHAFEALDAWGFRYGSMGFWHKKTKHNKTAFGTGYLLRSAAEPWLIGVRGKPKNSRSHRNLIEGEAREHSRKPEEAYAWCESYLPEAQRCEIFSRERRPKWDCWGNELDHFQQSEALGLEAVA
jgi:N6-adenosine-specific RNA methylase IME4